jgi:MinD-like ATPase involved in chromosome partitioning or flagellar assembly
LSRRYWKRFKNVINVDSAKEFCREYSDGKSERAFFSSCVYQPAKVFAEKLFVEALEEKGVREVMFLGGGSASGKTTYVYFFPPDESDGLIVMDGTLSSITKATLQIEIVRKLGKRVRIVYVYCPIERAVGFALSRAITTGRTICLDVLAQTHFHSQKTVLVNDNYSSLRRQLRSPSLDSCRYVGGGGLC